MFPSLNWVKRILNLSGNNVKYDSIIYTFLIDDSKKVQNVRKTTF